MIKPKHEKSVKTLMVGLIVYYLKVSCCHSSDKHTSGKTMGTNATFQHCHVGWKVKVISRRKARVDIYIYI